MNAAMKLTPIHTKERRNLHYALPAHTKLSTRPKATEVKLAKPEKREEKSTLI